VLNRIEAQKLLSMTYDQGKEMAGHQQLTAETGIAASTRTPTDWCASTCQRE